MTIVARDCLLGLVALIAYGYVAYPLLVWTLSRFFGRMPGATRLTMPTCRRYRS